MRLDYEAKPERWELQDALVTREQRANLETLDHLDRLEYLE